MQAIKSVSGIPIRLTNERWFHIVENHDDVAGLAFEVLETISDPDFIVRGWKGELLAVRKINKKYLIVVYREINKQDGFVITAFATYKINQIKKRGIIWSKKKS
ncbi:MAG: PBECR2 nuclease fold domain-containing protein [bacterium]